MSVTFFKPYKIVHFPYISENMYCICRVYISMDCKQDSRRVDAYVKC